MNQYYEEWLMHSNLIFPAILKSHQTNYPTSESNAGHVTGLAFVGGSYVIGGALVVFGTPSMKAAGGTIMAFPDYVLYPLGYSIGEAIFDDWF